MVIVPVVAVSRLARYAVGHALSISQHVIAVMVVHEDADGSAERSQHVQRSGPSGIPECR